VPLRLRSTTFACIVLLQTNQSIARALRSTCYHKTTDRRALCSTTIDFCCSACSITPEHSCSCLQLNLNSTTTAPACSTTINSCCYARSTTIDPRCSACSILLTTAALPAANNYNYNYIRGRRQAPKDKA